MGSIATQLRIINNTPFDITDITVSEVDSFDWDGIDRPDKNFQHVQIPARAAWQEREELNRSAKSSWFRMTIRFATNDVLTFRNDQRDAMGDSHEKSLIRDYALEGPSASSFLATQAAGDGLNTFLITERVSAIDWMRRLPGTRKLSELTIPGTHETCALHNEGGFDHGNAKCQTMSVRAQLEAGIRSLDIRCRHINNALVLHHGPVYQQLSFGDGVRDVCIEFLKAHPTETIVMSIKKEHTDEGNTRSYEDTFDTYVQGFENYWYLGDQVPTVDQVRGKIVLLRRFDADRLPKGIQANGSAWVDNATFTLSANGVTLQIQDEYQIKTANDIDTKKQVAINNHLQDARTGDYAQWYINFCSATGPLDLSGADTDLSTYPEDVAEKVNPSTTELLAHQVAARFGTVMMDFPEVTPNLIIRTLITLNAF